MRPHWDNCITHFDDAVDSFVVDYFAGEGRTCLLVAGAGFDPRARLVAQRLSAAMGNRLEALQGDRRGQHSIRINQQWRLCFVWSGNGAEQIAIEDYH